MTFKCPKDLEPHRVHIPGYPAGDKQNGALLIKHKGLKVIFSNGAVNEGEIEWEHVSVSRQSRVPDYYDMCWIKELFWGSDAIVMELHVTQKRHVNFHPYCLHLWRPINVEIPTPPSIMVGPIGG